MINDTDHSTSMSTINCGKESGSLQDGKIGLPEIFDRLRVCFEDDTERDVFWKYTLLADRESRQPLKLAEYRANAEYLLHLETMLYRMNAGEIGDDGFGSKMDRLKFAVGLLQDSFHDPIRAPRHWFFNIISARFSLEPTRRGFALDQISDIRKSPLHLQISDAVPNDVLNWLLRDIFSASGMRRG